MGHLPVYSVSDEQEARDLLVSACGTNMEGQFVARELAFDQTLKNLQAFSDRLHMYHGFLIDAGKCRCETKP